MIHSFPLNFFLLTYLHIFQGSGNRSTSYSGRCQGKAPSVGSSVSRTPKSPWMPFPMLFAAISNKVPPKDMELISSNYELFRVC